MTALRVIGVIVLLLLLVALLRVGVVVTFGERLHVVLRLGPFARTLVPAGEKAPKSRKKTREGGPSGTDTAEKKKRALPKLSRSELRELIATVLTVLKKLLRHVCRRVRIDPLEGYVTVGGSDPADIAGTYGRLNAAMWSLMPRAEELFRIPDPSLHLRMDYDAEKTRAEGTIGVSIRIGDIVIIAAALAIPLLRWFRRLKKRHINDLSADKSAEQTNHTEPEDHPA